MTVDLNQFRDGMRRLTAGVCVIATIDHEGLRAGLTATAVCSVSAAPPTLLCCLNRTSATYTAIRANGRFAVNVLALSDRPVADRMATPGSPDEKFSVGLWTTLETGAPVLETALVAFDCVLAQSVEVGTHGILFGEIQALKSRAAHVKPLLYAHGGYGGFASVEAVRDRELLWMPAWGEDAS
jgi:flavin reductase (DIM6/NTAB) family NADH-FMN oxidoreductase RutF